jgi:pimeloyl-ACP methyl ester carboxylesterase
MGEALRQALPEEALAPGEGRNEVVERLVAMGCDLGPDVFVRQVRALQKRGDQQRTLRALKVPALILGGRHDRLCPPRRQDFMAAMAWTARLVIVETAGHVPTLEAPGAVNEALLAWLDRQAPLVLRRPAQTPAPV